MTCEQDAIMYITTNEELLINELEEFEVKTIFQTDKTKIKVMKEGKTLLQIRNYYGKREIADIFKEMMDCKLF